MANYRRNNLLSAESIATAGTKVIDIDTTDAISRFEIVVKGTNNGSTPTAHPAKMVSLIELVDGSDKLFSLSGTEAQALNFFEEGKMPFIVNETENDIQCCATYHLNFGRWLWDTSLALDPKRFKNLQLKITHNKALGGSAPDAGTLSVWSQNFDQKTASPSGFLMAKEHYNYTLTASGHEYVDLPTDYPIRHLQLASMSTSNSPSGQIDTITMEEDSKKRIPLNAESVSNLLKLPPNDAIVEGRFAVLGTGSAVACFIDSSYETEAVAIGRSASQTTLIAAQPAGGGMNVTNDSSEAVSVFTRGNCPHGTFELLNHDFEDGTDWYDVTKLKNLKLDLTAGSGASGTAQVILQQLRRY